MAKKFPTRTVVTVAALSALSVVFRLFLGFPQTGNTRYDLGFLPIAAAGIMFGPLWSGAAYVLADLAGTFAAGQTPFLPITVCKFFFGAAFGVFFYKKSVSRGRIIACSAAISAVVDLLLMPLALAPIMGKGVWALFISRLPQAGIMFPVRALAIWLMNRYLGKYMVKYSA